MKSTGDMKRTRVLDEEGQKSSGRNSPLVENVEPLTDTVKRLKEKNERLTERFEVLEALMKKTSATEGKAYRTLCYV